MLVDTLKDTIVTLKKERDRIDAAIAALEGFSGGPGARARVGRPPGKGKKGRKRKGMKGGGGSGKKAPRGLLKEMIRKTLTGAKAPLTAAAIRDKVISAGYPVKKRNAFYTSVFVTAQKDPEIKKTKAGFRLRKKK
jgi:hypothetical protein